MQPPQRLARSEIEFSKLAAAHDPCRVHQRGDAVGRIERVGTRLGVDDVERDGVERGVIEGWLCPIEAGDMPAAVQ